MERQPQTPEALKRDFATEMEGGERLAKKYDASDDPRTRERLAQYRAIAGQLNQRFKQEPQNRMALMQELTQVNEELNDTITRRNYNRTLTRRNRFDTDEEYRVVLRESADYHQRLERQKAQKKGQRENREQLSREMEKQWMSLPFVEVSYRLIMSNGRGADDTIRNSADRLMKQIDLLKVVKAEDLPSFLAAIDVQIKNNRELTPPTKKRLEMLKKALQ